MNKAEEFRKLMEDYHRSKQVKAQINSHVSKILRECETQAKVGRDSYYLPPEVIRFEFINDVFNELRAEGLKVNMYDDYHGEDWFISW